MKAEALFVGAFLAATAWTADASAFCRAATDTGPMDANGCPIGKPLYWPKRCIGYSINSAASAQIHFATASAVIEKAFSSWTTALCDGGSALPSMQVFDLGPTNVAAVEYNTSGSGIPNTNLFVFRDQSWPHLETTETLALPTITYDDQSGKILDVDVEFNTAQHAFTVGDAAVQYDFLSIATHSVGHFFGFAHSEQPGSVMTPGYEMGMTNLRDPSADDLAGMCAVFPPNGDRVTAAGTLQAEPCGFGVVATDHTCPSSTVAGCSLSPSSGDAPSSRWAPLGLVAAVALYRARRSSQRSAARRSPALRSAPRATA